jgi:hypothetical protein
MRKDQINPGSIHPIFEFSENEPRRNRTQLFNEKIVKKKIKFSFDKLQFMGDYIRLSVNVNYELIGERGSVLDPVKQPRYSYKIINANGITGEELFVVLQNCTERINTFIKNLNEPLKNVPDLLPEPVPEDHYEDLEKIAQEIENHYS